MYEAKKEERKTNLVKITSEIVEKQVKHKLIKCEFMYIQIWLKRPYQWQKQSYPAPAAYEPFIKWIHT